MNNYILNRTLTILLGLQIILVGWASRNPNWVEKYYARGIYPEISGFMRRLLGWIPFSVGDVLYALLFIGLLGWIWYLYETRFSPVLDQWYRIGAFLSLLFLAFHFLWGLNYYRMPLQEQLGLKTLQYDTLALQKTTELHIAQLNYIHGALVKNDSLVVEVPYSKRKIGRMAAKQYRHFQNDTLDFHFRIKSVKKSLFSVPLSYMGFAGYLNPFTGESQINRKIPISTYPITVTHEMAHQLGYASETEANYIGYLACTHHPDLYFQYSAEFMAVRFLIHEVSRYNKPLAEAYYHSLHVGIQMNIEHNQDFWDSYSTPIKPISQKTYDQFLKANSQHAGLKSYNAMVAFLIQTPIQVKAYKHL